MNKIRGTVSISGVSVPFIGMKVYYVRKQYLIQDIVTMYLENGMKATRKYTFYKAKWYRKGGMHYVPNNEKN